MKRLVWCAILASIVSWAPIYEDNPAWNCRTMGNRVCGQVVVNHDRLTEIEVQRAAEEKYRSQSLEWSA